MAAVRGGEGRPEAATANASFMAGYNARTPVEKAGILTDFEALALPFMAGRTGKPDATAAEALAWYREADAGAELERIRREHPGDKGRLRAAVAFFNAASAYEGLLAGARDRMDNAAASARQELRRMTYGGDGGHLQPLTLKDGRQVYLVSGHAAEHHSPAWEPEDPIDSLLRRLRMGHLDLEMSDRTLVVADPGTGRLEMIPARRVRSVGERVPFEGEAARQEAEARERTARQEAAEIDGPIVVVTAAPTGEGAASETAAAPAGEGPAAAVPGQEAAEAGAPAPEVPLELNDRLDFTGPDGGAVRAEIASVPDTDGMMDVLITDGSGQERVERLTADGVRGLGTLTHRNGEPVGAAEAAEARETGREAAAEAQPSGTAAQTDAAQAGNASAGPNETDRNGFPFVKSSDGTTAFGEVREESGLQPAPIRLSEGFNRTDGQGGNIGYGLEHIKAGHGEQILKAGYRSVEEFVEDVARNYQEIRIGRSRRNNRTYMLLELHDEKHKRTLYVELSHDGTYWNVNSGGIFKSKYTDKNDIAWPEPTVGSSASTGAAGVVGSPAKAAEGETADRGGNSPQPISAGKVSENAATAQGKAGKSLSEAEEKAQRRNRQRRRMDKGLATLRESDSPLAQINAISQMERNAALGEDVLTGAEKAEIESRKAALKAGGYEWDALRPGMAYNDGMKATAEFEDNEALEPGERRIRLVRKPQINKDGKMVQTADIVVEQSPYESEAEKRAALAEKNGGNAQGKAGKSSSEAEEKAAGAAEEEAPRLEDMPEWHMDAPEDARKRGARRYGGQLFTRQEPVRGVVGKEIAVKFSQKDLPKGHVVVMEASQLQPSHVQGQRNPMFFIDEAQPKNRTDAVSRYAAQRIAEGIRPEEITGSVTAYTGAPTVNSRGEVIQGNNRSDALRFLWESRLPERQAAYTQYLIDNAERFGIDPEAVRGMRQPVLVNMLDVDDAEAIRLGQMTAQDTESGGVERIRPKNLAQKLGDGMRQFANMLLGSADEEATFGQLVDLNGADVMKWLNQTGAISSTQYQSAFDRKGNLTPEAKNDLQKVLYQSVFKGGPQQLEELFEKLPSKAQRAILATAYRDMDSPSAGKMLHEIQASIVAYSELMRSDDFAAARKMENVLWAVESFRRQISLDDRFEPYMPADNFSNFALHLAAMYKASDFSQKTLAATFSQMYDLAQGKVGATLFEEADTTEHTLAEVIEKVLGIKYKPAKNGNSNVANGGPSVALPDQTGQGGEPRGNEPPAGGEQAPPGAGPSERGGRAADDGAAARADAALTGNAPAGPDGTGRSGEDRRMAGRGLSPDEARRVVAWMDGSAAVVPELELTPENWDAEFGESGMVETPVGKVKMGEGQYLKLQRKKRDSYFGMVKPTLTNPDLVLGEYDPKEGAERTTKYLFVKTFIKPDGSRIVHFESVTVRKDSLEVSISSHEINENALIKKVHQDKLIHLNEKFSSSDVRLAEPQEEGPDLVPTPNLVSSAGKDSQNGGNRQGKDGKSAVEEAAAEPPYGRPYTSAADFLETAHSEISGDDRLDGATVRKLKAFVERALKKRLGRATEVDERGARVDSATVKGLYSSEKDLLWPFSDHGASWIDDGEKAVYYLAYYPARYKGREDVVRVRKEYFEEGTGAGEFTLSDSAASNGERFYQDGNGSIDLVSIPEEIFRAIGRESAPFRLTPSMLLHIYDRHGKEMGLSNPQEAIAFVLDVMRNFDHVRKGEKGAIVFSVENGRSRTARRTVTILGPSADGSYYGVKTSGYERLSGLEKRTLLWEKGAKVASPAGVAPATVPTASPQQGNGARGSASDGNNVTAGKDSENGGKAQGKAGKSSPEKGGRGAGAAEKAPKGNPVSVIDKARQAVAAENKTGKKARPSLLDAVGALYTRGKEYAGRLYQRMFFDVAETPGFMKRYGLTGDRFTIRYGVIARHLGKDGSHDLPESVWRQLPEALQHPFAITEYYADTERQAQKGYRLYTSLRLDDGSFVVVSAEVKNAGRDIEVNAINTVFGRDKVSEVHDKVVYVSETITPEQQALLDGNNPRQYPAGRELSAGKVSQSAATGQGKKGKSSPAGPARAAGTSDTRTGNVKETARGGSMASLPTGVHASGEKNEFGQPFVVSSDGTTTFGVIPAASGLKPAPIKLSLGENYVDEGGANRGYGLLHIDANRGEQIKKAGYSSVEEFVEDVARNYTVIKEGSLIGTTQTYLLELHDKHNNTLFVELSRDGSYWNVNSAGIFREGYSRTKKEVFTVPAIGDGTVPDTNGVNSGHEFGTTAPAGNSPETSAGKDSKNAGNGQGDGADFIDDYGEVIAGARKDAMRELARALGAVDIEDLMARPFGQVFKKPDYARMAADGKISRRDALVLEALARSIRPKPRKDMEVERWARDTKEWLDLIKKYAEGSEEVRREIHDGIDGHTDRTGTLMYILDGLGFPDAKVGKFSVPEIMPDSQENGHYRVGKRGTRYFEAWGARFGNREEALREALRRVKVGLGYDDIGYTADDFRFTLVPYKIGDKNYFEVTREENGKKSLDAAFPSREEAEAYAAQKNGGAAGGVYAVGDYDGDKGRETVMNACTVIDPYAAKALRLNGVPLFARLGDLMEYKAGHMDGLGRKANGMLSARYSGTGKTTPGERLKIFGYHNRKTGDYEICVGLDRAYSLGNNGFGNMLTVKTGLRRNEVGPWIEAHREEVAALLAEMNRKAREGQKFIPDRERKGPDYRHGRNVTPEELARTFGFRGVQFGNWASQEDRQAALNNTYDALLDLCHVLGVSPRALSLSGELGIAFGARGSGEANAHYEPGEVVINLTRTRGAGSLAHEWWHALDNYFARRGGKPGDYLTEAGGRRFGNVREEMRQAYDGLSRAVERSAYHGRNGSSGYWGIRREETARLFAKWVSGELERAGRNNDFLAHRGIPSEDYKRAMYKFMQGLPGDFREGKVSFDDFRQRPEALLGYRDPTTEELAELGPKMRGIFDTVREKEEGGHTVLYRLDTELPPESGEDVPESFAREHGLDAGDVRAYAEGMRRGNVIPLSERFNPRRKDVRFRLGDPAATFEARQRAAVESRGTVMPGLNGAEVKAVEVPRHEYKGTAMQAKEQAVSDSRGRYLDGNGTPKTQRYDNFGRRFDYTISGNSIAESMNPTAQHKSANLGVHIAVLNHLPEVIGQSVEAEEHPDYMKNAEGKRTTERVNSDVLVHRFYGAVEIDGEIYRVKTTMKESRDPNIGNSQYTYEVTNVEVLTNTGSASTSNGMGSIRSTESVHSHEIVYPLAKLLRGVEKSHDPGKELLSESGDLTDFGHFREKAAFSDGQRLPIAETSEDGRRAYRVEGLGGTFASREELLDAFREKYPGYVSALEGDALTVEPWGKYLAGRRPTAAERRSEAAYLSRKTRRAREAVAALAARLNLDGVEVLLTTDGLTGARARAKGWYDPSTGKIVIVLPNHADVGDVVRTLLHEGVAHHGLRQLFGRRFDTFLDNVLSHAAPDVRQEIVSLAARRGWDFRTATEEYLAGLAEDTDFERAERSGWWRRIKEWFLGMLRDLGLPGFSGGALTDSELRYVLWRSYENLRDPGRYRNVFAVAEDVAMQSRLGVGDYAAGDGSRESRVAEPARDMAAVNARFNGELRRYTEGYMATNEMFHLGLPQGAMRAFLPNLPIVMRQRVVSKGTEKKHHVGIEALHDMPQMISEPIMIFQRDTDTIGILTEMRDREGKNVCVAIEMRKSIQSGKDVLVVNDVRSFHGREVKNIVLPVVNNGTLRWVDKQKALDWLSSASQQAQQEIGNQELSSAAKVVENFENPPVEGEKNDGVRESGSAMAGEPAGDYAVPGTLASVNERFNEQLDGLTAENADRVTLSLGRPSAVLRSAGVEDRPMKLYGNKVMKKMRKHGFTLDELRDLPSAVADPIAVFDNYQKDGNRSILTELSTKDGNFLVAVTPGVDGDIDFNIVSSVFGKRNSHVVDWLNNGLATYVNKEKALELLSHQSAPIAATAASQELSSAAKVVENFENPPVEGEKNDGGTGILFRDGDGDGPLVPSSPGLDAGELASRLLQEAARSAAREREGAAAVRERRGVNVRDAYDRQVAGSAYQGVEALQDSMLGLKTLMMDIWKAEGRDRTGLRHIEDIPAFENAYLAENRMSSANKAQADEYARDYMKPLLKEVQRLAYSGGSGRGALKRNYSEVTDYMMARHGLERNEVMARREAERKFARERQKVERQMARIEARHADNPGALESDSAYQELQGRLQDIDGRVEAQYLKNRKKDYAGLTGLTGADTVAVAEEKAREAVAAFEAAHETAELWRLVNAATGQTLRTLYEAGLLDKARYEEIRGMYAHYIPLRGFAGTTSDEVYGYLEGRDALERGNILKRARGRSTKADDPLATMAAMAEAGIAQANRNRMKQAFMNFAINHPSDAVTVGDIWLHYDGADGRWHPVFPDIGAGDDAETVARKLKDFNAAMRERAREAPEDYLHGKDAVGVPYIIRPADMREHQVVVRRGGRDFVLTVNGSPRAAQALNGLSNPSSIEGKLLQAAANLSGYVTRAMSQWYTQRNPSFVMGNFIRDMQYANSTVWVKESAAYARRFNLNCAKYNPAALRALFHKYRRGTLDMGKPVEKYFHEFMHEGGETGSCF